MIINPNLAHNDPDRLRSEFLEPLRELLESHEMAKLNRISSSGAEVAFVQVRKYHRVRPEAAICSVVFYRDGKAATSTGSIASGEIEPTLSWTQAGKALMALVLENANEEFRRAAENLWPGIVALRKIYQAAKI
ncbi:MAG TPA: hypothetical protein VF974_04640 [Patescibacteria group bacterium]